MEIGITTFAETSTDAATGKRYEASKRLAEVVAEAKLADELGLDVYAVGEHHRPDFAAASPAVILGGIATVTENIRLASAVTVLSTDDPVRVFEDFTAVDLLSNGRAEIWAGRGSFTESFPLFGYDLSDYDRLYADKLDLLLKLRENERVTWSGIGRPAMHDLGVWPRPVQDPLPVWVGVGGNPNSVVRAGTLGLPLVIAIIGGEPRRFTPLVELYRESAKSAGHEANARVAINSHGFIAETAEEAVETFYPPYAEVMSTIGRERGWSPMTRAAFEGLRSPRGSLLLGSPQDVIDKMLYEYDLFRYDRFLMHLSVGTVPHDKVMRAIELLGTVVAPAVKQAIAEREASEPVTAG